MCEGRWLACAVVDHSSSDALMQVAVCLLGGRAVTCLSCNWLINVLWV